MARTKQTARFSIGTRIRVKPGVTAPEFPDVPCQGWTGGIVDQIGKKSAPKFVVEWDASTLENMPASYVEQCEQSGLFYRMACFTGDQLEPADD